MGAPRDNAKPRYGKRYLAVIAVKEPGVFKQSPLQSLHDKEGFGVKAATVFAYCIVQAQPKLKFFRLLLNAF